MKKQDEKTRIEISFLLEKVEIYYLEINRKKRLSNDDNKNKLGKIVNSLHALKKNRDCFLNQIKEYKEIIEETENTYDKELLEKELLLTLNEEEKIVKKIEEIILNDEIKNNCIVEIRPGVGGVEAGLFVRDLYEMYYKFSEKKSWKIEIFESKSDSIGNFSFISFLVKGNEAFKWLKNESGVHRVQRIPLTESKGRLQTSTVTVVVMPEINDIQVEIKNNNLKIDTYRSGGAGGQHVNTTDSAIRITHIPTGTVATSQSGRSQHENKDKAMIVLKSRLHDKYKKDQENELGNIRSSAIGNSERSEKIRTYNYPQNRVTDHRINLNLNKLNTIIEGNLDELCKSLISFEINKKLENFIKKISKEKE